MTLLLRFLPHGIIAIAAFGIGYWIADMRGQNNYARLDTEFLQYRLDHEAASKKATEEILERERAQAELNRELSLNAAAKDAEITKLALDVRRNVGALRLCKSERSAARMPEREDQRARGDPEAAAGEVVSPEITGSLVELAADADRVMNQLETCQSFVNSLR